MPKNRFFTLEAAYEQIKILCAQGISVRLTYEPSDWPGLPIYRVIAAPPGGAAAAGLHSEEEE